MSNIGYLSTVTHATVPFDITSGADVPSTIISPVNVFNTSPLSQSTLNNAYTFSPPATISLLSQESATALLNFQSE